MAIEEETPTVKGAGSPSMDPNHLYFLHSSDHPGMNLVNTIFDGTWYGGWCRSVLIALSAKNKIAFIDGTCIAPASNSPEFKF
ncbi:hypothetical protein KY290_037050 [Solanum tuberosum]|uniref:Retrotransposon Copia-like N-terminal domain-containing protein n=1 Tax=Solanum tuberosum TaxID=4113 RepID=A0ABQ7TV22_SOLTU|nr:hypothetical protein KY290_037050 [Solanum tuberosum]